jgi:hypothetical protein
MVMDLASIVLYGSGVLVSAAALRLGPRWLQAVLMGVAAVAFVPGWIGMSALCPGGSALQGGVDAEGYYLGRHGAKLARVGRSTYGVCLGAEATALLSHAVFVGAFISGWRKREDTPRGTAEQGDAPDEARAGKENRGPRR